MPQIRRHRPSRNKAKGYDLLVWVDADGDVVSSSYTAKGTKAMQKLVKEYETGDIAEILVAPDVFYNLIEGAARIGLVNSATQEVTEMSKLNLH